MTFSTRFIGVMVCRINGREIRSLARWIWQARVTSDTQGSAPVDYQLLRFFRMIQRRAVTVFTLNDLVLGTYVLLIIIFMAVAAVFLGLILDLEGLPVILIAPAVETVHKTPFTDDKVPGNNKMSCDQCKYDHPDQDEHRSPRVTFQFCSLFTTMTLLDEDKKLRDTLSQISAFCQSKKNY